MGGKEPPPSASITGLRAQLHVSIDAGAFLRRRRHVTHLFVDKFSQDLPRPIPIESERRFEPRLSCSLAKSNADINIVIAGACAFTCLACTGQALYRANVQSRTREIARINTSRQIPGNAIAYASRCFVAYRE